MDQLFLLHANQRRLFGEFKQNAPSQFLAEIPEELWEGTGLKRKQEESYSDFSMDDGDVRLIPMEDDYAPTLELREGDRIRHRSFGEGMVLKIQGGVAQIAFKDPRVGTKKLALSIAPLEKIWD